jgi:hypothetical protein
VWLILRFPAVTSTVSSLIDICDRILKGQEVDLNCVEAVHQAVLRGDIITQVRGMFAASQAGLSGPSARGGRVA